MADLLSFTAFTCERILQEMDGSISAIRLIDIFRVPVPIPPDFKIAFWLVAIAKYRIGQSPGKAEFKITQIRTNRDRIDLGSHAAESLVNEIDGQEIVPGLGLIVQFNVKVDTIGTDYLEIELDGTLRATVPITLLAAKPHQDK
jgi:hypothetical protein